MIDPDLVIVEQISRSISSKIRRSYYASGVTNFTNLLHCGKAKIYSDWLVKYFVKSIENMIIIIFSFTEKSTFFPVKSTFFKEVTKEELISRKFLSVIAFYSTFLSSESRWKLISRKIFFFYCEMKVISFPQFPHFTNLRQRCQPILC